MTEIALLNPKFEKSGSVKANIDLSVEKINGTVVHQVVKATLAGRRQGTAMTKTKAMVSGGGKKGGDLNSTNIGMGGVSNGMIKIAGGKASNSSGDDGNGGKGANGGSGGVPHDGMSSSLTYYNAGYHHGIQPGGGGASIDNGNSAGNGAKGLVIIYY